MRTGRGDSTHIYTVLREIAVSRFTLSQAFLTSLTWQSLLQYPVPDLGYYFVYDLSLANSLFESVPTDGGIQDEGDAKLLALHFGRTQAIS